MDGLTASIEKMRRAGLPDAAIRTFEHYYRQLAEGETGLLPESAIEPVESVPNADELAEPDAAEALARAVVIKLNGGLGTSMGMRRAKSLLEARTGLSFLDIIVRQVFSLRKRFGIGLPLMLMNSFATREDSLRALSRHPGLEVEDLPLDFLQNKEPKLRESDLMPISWPSEPALEWCPPGHGDLYTALVTSGTLEKLLAEGYRWAFVSNSDNLGAVLEPRILAWMAAGELPFVMEVADRTEADRKGGHLARRAGGGLVLREIAQTPEDDHAAFQDVTRHRFFNTNNLWVDLEALARVMDERDGVLGLPMIVNRKTVDPSDVNSPKVIQIETAMGSAVDVFEGAGAVRVPKRRFAPVKTTDDLLVLRSDAYDLREDGTVELVADELPVVDLDSGAYKLVGDFEQRFPAGPPSLRECRKLTIRGDVTFGDAVVVCGRTVIEGSGHIEDGTVLEGEVRL